MSLLTNRSAVATRDVYGSGPIACVTNARQPVVATVWMAACGSWTVASVPVMSPAWQSERDSGDQSPQQADL